MEFFDLVNSIIDVPNTKEEFVSILKIAEKNRNKKIINFNDSNEVKLNKKGLYILITLVNHKRFYDSLPHTEEANEFKKNGYFIVQNVTVTKDNKVKGISELCKKLFNIETKSVSLTKQELNGPHTDRQNQIHLDRAHPTIKWFLYMNDVTKKNGAFCYSKGSHVPTKEKLEFLYRVSCMSPKDPMFSSHADRDKLAAIRVAKNNNQKEDELIKEMKFEPCNPLEYNAKTLIIVDTSGFHKRGIIDKNQTRKSLLNQKGFPDWHTK